MKLQQPGRPWSRSIARPAGSSATRGVRRRTARPTSKGLTAQFAAGLAIGLGALGGTLGTGQRCQAPPTSRIARNPQAADKISTPFFIGMALIESLVIFAWVMCLFILGVI